MNAPWSSSSLSPTTLLLISRCFPDAARLGQSISIWAPRPHPFQRGTAVLKCYNKNFCDLCEESSFGSGLVTDVFPTSGVFAQSTAIEAQATMEQAMIAVDLLHQGSIRQARFNFLHLSRKGQARRVIMEVIGVYVNRNLSEWVLVEALVGQSSTWPLPASPEFTYELSLREEYRDLQQIPEITDADSSIDDPSAWKWIPDPTLRKLKRICSTEFYCHDCGVTKTTQTRRGPEGMGTLCNKCGLRRIRQRYAHRKVTETTDLLATRDATVTSDVT